MGTNSSVASIIPIIGKIAGIALLIGIIVGIIFIVKKVKQTKLNGVKISKKWCLITIFTVVIMFLSWLFNIGWFRIILMWIPIPLLHTIFFMLINFKASAKVLSFKNLEKYMIYSCVTFLLSYLLFPDGGDIGEMYFFFGLIRSNFLSGIVMFIAVPLWIANIVFLILEYLELKKCKDQ